MGKEKFDVFARVDSTREFTREEAELLVKYSTMQMDDASDEWDLVFAIQNIFDGNGYIPGDVIMELAYELGYDDEAINAHAFYDVEF